MTTPIPRQHLPQTNPKAGGITSRIQLFLTVNRYEADPFLTPSSGIRLHG